jgi:hypothetical protein
VEIFTSVAALTKQKSSLTNLFFAMKTKTICRLQLKNNENETKNYFFVQNLYTHATFKFSTGFIHVRGKDARHRKYFSMPIYRYDSKLDALLTLDSNFFDSLHRKNDEQNLLVPTTNLLVTYEIIQPWFNNKEHVLVSGGVRHSGPVIQARVLQAHLFFTCLSGRILAIFRPKFFLKIK